MKIIFRYLKPYALLVILAVGMLFGEATTNLVLPNLMSDIVNTGIQQGGIEKALPQKLSTNAMALLTYFIGSTDVSLFRNAYADDMGVYELRAEYKSEAAIDEIYNRAVYAMYLFVQDSTKQSSTGSASTNSTSNMDVSSSGMSDPAMLYKMLPMLSQVPVEVLNNYITEATTTDSMMSGQIAKALSKLFMAEVGEDVNAIQMNYIFITGMKMLGVSLLGIIASIIAMYLFASIGSGVSKKMRRDVFQKVTGFSNAEFNKFSTASLITRSTNDVAQVQMFIIMGMRMMCFAPIMGIGGTIFALQKSTSMSWIILVAVAFLLILIVIVFKTTLPKFTVLQTLIDKLNLVSRENLSGMLVIRAFGNEQYEEERFKKANDDLYRTNYFVQKVMSINMPVMMLIMNLISLLIIWVGSHQIAESTMQIGDMMAFIQYAMQIIMSFLFIAMMFIFLPRASVSAKRIGEVLDTEPVILDPEKPVSLSAKNTKKGRIEFKDVSFRYENAEEDALTNITFTANPGETTAFIGSTGSGKTTLINLIPRLYDVTAGSIEFDGVDIRKLKQSELRDSIGYVSQKGILFSGDIRSNVAYGKEHANEDEIMKAIEVAQAKDFVNGKEDGIQSEIAQGGDNVSGGQKQRLSIARALIKKPPIYIFDDSFSALDFKTDAALRRALKQYTGDATVLIVAQRVSTIMNAQQIIVLDEGKIVGMGTHSELIKSCEQYREIAESQLSKEALA